MLSQLSNIKRVLVDEQVPGDIVGKIREKFGEVNIEVKWINTDFPELRGKEDDEILEWMKEKGFDTILTANYDMARRAVLNKINILLLFIYDNHRKFVLTRIVPITGWKIKIIIEEISV